MTNQQTTAKGVSASAVLAAFAIAPFLLVSCGGLSKSDRETVDILPIRANPVDPASAATGASGADANAAPTDSVLSQPAEPPYSLENAEKYIIQSGDSLSAISDKYGVSVADIKAANKIPDANKIRAGQTLLLPGKQSDAAEPDAAEPEATGESAVPVAPAPDGDSPTFELPRIDSGS